MMRAITFMSPAAVLLTLTTLGGAEETKGTIKSVDTGRQEVVLKGLMKDSIYELKKDATVWLDGFKSKLADLRADDTAHITYEKKGEHMKAIYVRVLRKAQDANGTVRGANSQRNEVILKGLVKDTIYEMAPGGTVWLSDTKQGTVADLREGDEVRITYEQRGEHLMAAEVYVTKRK
jgi:Cu/Ag efflux protein CusF